MPDTYFSPGDTCRLTAFIRNFSGSALNNVPFFVILDVYGQRWFFDDWTGELDYQTITVPPGTTEKTIIEEFTWPDTGNQTAEDIVFLSAVLNQEFTQIFGGADGLGRWSFGFGP